MTRLVDPTTTVSDFGEKLLIEELLRPLFNPNQEKNSIGDDCAAVEIPANSLAIFSTDRIPADLISFRTGILNFRTLGRYLGVLNLSDIAACGGIPLALLFNCGLPGNLLVQNFRNIGIGFQEIAVQFGANVVGGDITSSMELSLSAMVLGHVEKNRMLRRTGANIGDTVFVSREIGLTPVALDYCLQREQYTWLNGHERTQLEAQFTSIEPEIYLGRKLSQSRHCTSCIDNTDGVGQSLVELARESKHAVLILQNELQLNPLITRAAERKNWEPIEFALGPGADFGLVGTLAGDWADERAKQVFGSNVRVIGKVIRGAGVFLQSGKGIQPLNVRGWNYFQ
jgi:thiamine-monophosphate kinase